MNDDEIILRLTRELYDLKAKLSGIRKNNDIAYDLLSSKDELLEKDKGMLLHVSIEIANELDTGIDYD